ncbi:MAG TPA: efflux transporter outer membrane subunit [Burkholderiales bacterium]|nr:efflux transporter outer membrane subunit [Burkholderiales bacterium]
MRFARVTLTAAALALLGACSMLPPYQRPAVEVPAAWRVEAPWREGKPNDAAPKGPWWLRFRDPDLDRLVEKALIDSPTLALASARLAQARASLSAATSALFPQVTFSTRAQNLRISANRPLTNYRSPNFSTIQDDFVLSLGVSYEADVFGRVESTVAGARASVEQSMSDFENTRLLLVADLATAYFNLRQVDVEIAVLTRAIELQKRSLGFVTNRRDLGAASGLDVAQQQSLIDSTLTQLDLLRRQRSQFENAIATLTGTPAPSFSVQPSAKRAAPPDIPLGVPSDILERRPDVAAAERAMAAANAQIGVAKAAFYPSIVIGPSYGFQSTSLSTLFDTPSTIWSLGGALLQPLFNAGRLDANLALAKAGYEGTVANYRRVVLTAMQEAEDGILGGAALERAHTQAQAAVQSARRVLDLATTRYEGGIATYLDVITAQQALLNAERQASQIEGQRLLVSVFLVKALGGDWK